LKDEYFERRIFSRVESKHLAWIDNFAKEIVVNRIYQSSYTNDKDL